jgi:hypothetical protein
MDKISIRIDFAMFLSKSSRISRAFIIRNSNWSPYREDCFDWAKIHQVKDCGFSQPVALEQSSFARRLRLQQLWP